MTTISAKSDVMTLINMFTVEPANQGRLVELLTEATEVSVGPAPLRVRRGRRRTDKTRHNNPNRGRADLQRARLTLDVIVSDLRQRGAIRERRLYGLMLQEQAESAVGAGQWIKKTIEEVIAE